MTKFRAQVQVGHLPGVLDPQGAVVERALPALGYSNVGGVSIGKVITLDVEAVDEATAMAQVDEMCQKLLANPVIETYEVTVSPA